MPPKKTAAEAVRSGANGKPAPPLSAGEGGGARFTNVRLTPELPGLSDPAGVAPATAEFKIYGVDLCVVNALRRSIMADVRTAAIPFNPTQSAGGGDNGIVFHKNTSVLHNEFLGHRISLVPIAFDERQLKGFDAAARTFVIKVKNAGEELLNVTTGDIKVLDVTGAALPEEERESLFPASRVTGDHVLLVRLKPSPTRDGEGEALHVECKARLGCGREHSRWSPVSACYFGNMIDDAAFEATLAAKLDRKKLDDNASDASDASHAAAVRTQHAAMDGKRAFVKNAYGEPSAFDFTLRTETRIRPAYVVLEGFGRLIDKVRRLADGVRAAAAADAAAAAGKDDDDDGWGGAPAAQTASGAAVADVRVRPLANMDDFYEVVVQGEDHTLGNLVQGLLYRHWVREGASAVVSFVGYHQPHPLEDHIVVKLKCAKPGDDVCARLAEGLDWVRAELQALSALFEAAQKGT